MFFIFVHKADANLEIAKVNYNPPVKTDHLWVKIYNNSSDSVDLTTWSIADFDGTSWHYHALNADTSSILGSNSYAIVAKASSSTINEFKSKNSDISDLLFYGNLTIGSEGIIALSQDKKNVISKTSYGGEDTSVVNISNDDTTNTISESSASPSDSSPSKIVEKVYISTTKIISPKTVTAGIPFTISHQTFGVHKEKVILGKFVWNLGDGVVKVGEISDPFLYEYEYPGEYVITLSFYNSVLSESTDATDRITVKVIPSGLNIISVGTISDPYVEIENTSSSEMNLNNFILKGRIRSFPIPDGTVILPKNKLKISPRITGFDYEDISSLVVMDSSGQVFATYPNKIVTVPKKRGSSSSGATKTLTRYTDTLELKTEDKIIDLNNLGANAFSSESSFRNINYAWIGLGGIILIGIISTIFIRNKSKYGDYVEEDLSAKGMTIIE